MDNKNLTPEQEQAQNEASIERAIRRLFRDVYKEEFSRLMKVYNGKYEEEARRSALDYAHAKVVKNFGDNALRFAVSERNKITAELEQTASTK